MIRILILVIALVVSAPVAAEAPEQAKALETGIAAFEKGDVNYAASIFTTLARDGIAEAQYRLGCMRVTGAGVAENHGRAFELLIAAATQYHLAGDKKYKNPWMAAILVRLEEEPIYISASTEQLFDELFKSKHPESLFVRGSRLVGEADQTTSAREKEQLLNNSVKLFKASAEAGFARAQYILGWHYSIGLRVSQSNEQALFWYNKAFKNGAPMGAYGKAAILWFDRKRTGRYAEIYYWTYRAILRGIRPEWPDLGTFTRYLTLAEIAAIRKRAEADNRQYVVTDPFTFVFSNGEMKPDPTLYCPK